MLVQVVSWDLVRSSKVR